MNEEKKSQKKKMELPFTIAVSIMLWFLVLFVFFAANDMKAAQFFSLSKHMIADVDFSNGISKHFENGNFKWLHRGDKARITFDLKDDALSGQDNVELYIPLYNAVVNVYMGNETLYQDKYDPDNIAAHYGGRMYWVPLPLDYRNHTLVMEVIAVEDIPFSNLQKIGIVRADEGWKKIIEGNSFIFSISLSIMILSLVCIFFFIVRSIMRRKLHIGLPIAVFELVITAWFLGSLGMFYLFVGNVDFCSKIEYYSLYFATIPLAFFICLVLEKPVMKRIVQGQTLLYTAFYVVSTIIELSPIQKNYSTMMSIMHILAGITILLLVIAVFAGTRHETNNYISILRYGVLISMLCGVIELVRFNLTKYIFQKTWFATHGLSAFAILVIAVSLVIYLISISAEEYTNKIERKKLLELAFKDALTDMPNRADCYRQIERMEAEQVKVFTMVFIDLNNLKVANDVYGHELGDRLLITAAGFIKEIFSESGFCGRWGGDEFVACAFCAESEAMKRIERFRQKMDEEDRKGTFPFSVSAACGYQCSDEEHYIEPINAIRQADAAMYENKKRMKAQR